MRGAARRRASGLWYLALALVATPVAAQTPSRGETVFHAAGCAACHTDVDHDGPPLAGGRALKTPFGTFYSPNITPDPVHGIGAWSDADFVRALRDGVAPDGRQYYPVFPYTSYTRMRREDMLALKRYLFSRKPVARQNRPHALPWYLSFRPLLRVWKWLYFEPGEFQPSAERSQRWNRGAYLVLALGHCAECHSPRNRFGAVERSLRFAGTREGPEGEAVPNITPDKQTGIGGWPRGDLAYFLQTGATPDGDYTGGAMAEVIDAGLSHLENDDLQAMAEYLRSLAPIRHRVAAPGKAQDKPPRNPWD